jgi:hypothetical protein
MKIRRTGNAIAIGLLTAGALLSRPGTTAAQVGACQELLTVMPLAGNPAVFAATSTQASSAGRAYCSVSVVWRDPLLVGEGAGYAPGNGPGDVGSYQHIRMAFALPLNTNTGNAAWGGRLIQTAGGLDQGSVAPVGGYVGHNPAAIGVSTDSGHGTADSGSGDSYGYVQNVRPNYGKLKDWAGGRSYCTAVKLAKELAIAYYGTSVQYTYWEGFSGGGHMGMTQVQNCPEEYDGLLIGAPAYHWQQFRLQDSWAAVVNRKAVQLGAGFSNAQLNAATSAAIAFCMTRGSGGVNVGGTNILHDPRSCDWNAWQHLCDLPTAPAPPNCLSATQAVLLNQILYGPRNAYGKLIYYPYSFGVGITNSTTPFALSTPQVMRWNHVDAGFSASNLFADQLSINLAGNPQGAITFENEMLLGSNRMSDYADTNNHRIDAARAKGLKIIQYHGTQDNLILYRQDPAYYRKVATYFGSGTTDYDSLRTWYRLFLVPGAGHAAHSWLPQLFDWVENGNPPDRIERPTGMRVVCPYPQYAQHIGGSTTDPNNFVCGGNLEDSPVAVCSMVKTLYKLEKWPFTNVAELGIDPAMCQPR